MQRLGKFFSGLLYISYTSNGVKAIYLKRIILCGSVALLPVYYRRKGPDQTETTAPTCSHQLTHDT